MGEGQGGEERKEGSVVGRFGQRTTDVDQIIGDDAEADPALYAGFDPCSDSSSGRAVVSED